MQGRLVPVFARGDVHNVARIKRVAHNLWEQQVDNLRKAATHRIPLHLGARVGL